MDCKILGLESKGRWCWLRCFSQQSGETGPADDLLGDGSLSQVVLIQPRGSVMRVDGAGILSRWRCTRLVGPVDWVFLGAIVVFGGRVLILVVFFLFILILRVRIVVFVLILLVVFIFSRIIVLVLGVVFHVRKHPCLCNLGRVARGRQSPAG
jgi:hypothetical protein